MPDRVQIALALKAAAGLVEVAKLGGSPIFSTSHEAYDESFSSYMSMLDEAMSAQLATSRTALDRAVGERLWPVPERRLRQVMLGAFLRVGRGDAIGCVSVNRRFYSVLVHEARVGELRDLIATMRSEINRDGVTNYQAVVQSNPGAKGAAAIHVMAHLVYLGHADYHDRWSVGRPLLRG